MFNCRMMPDECLPHKFDPVGVGDFGGGCAPFRYCSMDLCVIREIECNPANSCERASTCIPETARCKPIFYPDSHRCETGNFFTVPDSGYCSNGQCLGET